MRSMNMLQILGGVAVAGVVAAGTTALTGSGLTRSAPAAADAFVGGTITQNVTGANVDSITYTYSDTTNTKTTRVVFVVSGADTKYLTMKATGTGFGGGSPVADEWYCGVGTTFPNAGEAKIALSGATATVTCDAAANNTNAHSTAGRYFAGLTGMDVTVSNS